MSISFKDLLFSPQLLRALREKNYQTPTPIQQKTIPILLTGKDLLAIAQTGSGKTAGFTLPLLQNLLRLAHKERGKAPRGLILVPTRELALQIEKNLASYGKYLPFKCTAVFGGEGSQLQISKLKQGTDIVVATPGRLIDLASQKHIDLSSISIFVLDEADRMLSMGFIHQIHQVLSFLPRQRQSLLFSATFSPEMKELAAKILKFPKTIQTTQTPQIPEGIDQKVHPIRTPAQKQMLLSLLIASHQCQTLVFAQTKQAVDHLTKYLQTEGISASAIHGDKGQASRSKTLEDFRKGFFRVLVATDLAARGLDIQKLPLVINYELPSNPEEYVHRIGRTGRSGEKGKALSLVSSEEMSKLKSIEELLQQTIPQERISELSTV